MKLPFYTECVNKLHPIVGVGQIPHPHFLVGGDSQGLLDAEVRGTCILQHQRQRQSGVSAMALNLFENGGCDKDKSRSVGAALPSGTRGQA